MTLLTAKAKKELTDFLLEPFPDNLSRAWFLEKLDDDYLERVAELQLLTEASPNVYVESGLFTEEELDNAVRETITRIIHKAFNSTKQSLLEELVSAQHVITIPRGDEFYPALKQLFDIQAETNLLLDVPIEVMFLDKNSQVRSVGKTIHGTLYQQILLAFLIEFTVSSDLQRPTNNADFDIEVTTPLLFLPNHYVTNSEGSIAFMDEEKDIIKTSIVMQETFMTLATYYLPDLSSKQYNTSKGEPEEEFQRLIWDEFVYYQRVSEEFAKGVVVTNVREKQMKMVLFRFVDTYFESILKRLFPVLNQSLLNKTYQHQQTKEKVYVTKVISTPNELLYNNLSAKGFANLSGHAVCYHAQLSSKNTLPSTLMIKTFEDFIFDRWEIIPNDLDTQSEIDE